MGKEDNRPEVRVQDRVGGRAPGAYLPLVSYLSECCLDAPAFLVQLAPWGGEMGACPACHHELPAGAAARLRSPGAYER
jgi:hypothetical protein